MKKLKIKEEYYVIIKAKGIDGDSKNAHIFKCDAIESSRYILTVEKEAGCKIERASSYKDNYIGKALTEDEARLEAAEIQNEGDIDICGICVSTLYAK